MNSAKIAIAHAVDLLRSVCVTPIPTQTTERLDCFIALIREWGAALSLVSKRDREDRLEEHVVDCLGLIPVVESLGLTAPRILDIGSGAGFPAIPMATVLTGLDFTLVERSERKVGFLMKVKGALSLDNVSIVAGSYPESVEDRAPDVVTARAVDRPGLVLREVTERLSETGIFICQLRVGVQQREELSADFDLRLMDDLWQQKGLRRGECRTIQRKRDG